jgi:glycolate oxidase iron-sulfur subunit
MQTKFAPELLADPDMARSEQILRSCVHCGFCSTTCPTFLLNGDELDSPRGRIYLMKDMLENNRPADARTVRHIDRCLSCLACMTACPSGVHYMHLVDHARAHIEATYARPLSDRALRAFLALVLPNPRLFRLALRGARLAAPLRPYLRGRLRGIFDLAPQELPAASQVDRPQIFPPFGKRTARAALLNGCAQTVLDPAINEATIRFLTRHGVEVVVARGAGCCGALVHHLGKSKSARRAAAANVDAWTREIDSRGLDFIVANASGCGTMIKDYGDLFRADAERAPAAARISRLARDVAEVAALLPLQAAPDLPKLRVAYHSACSLQHGQKISVLPLDLLKRIGFDAMPVPDGHICCGSAGTYNLLQPDFATRLRARKIESLRATDCDVVAAGNIGCITQIASGPGAPPVVHTIELLDWATGGTRPRRLDAAALARV